VAITLEKHQVEGLEYAMAHHYCINGDEAGVGKTFQALALAQKTKLNTLIVCPAFLRENWLSEIKIFAPHKGVTVFRKRAQIYFPFDTDLVIISYSLVEHAKECFHWAELIIADEVHMVKNMECARGILFHQRLFESEAERFIGLTGTPIKNHVSDFYSLLGLTSYNTKPTSGLDIFVDYPTPIDFNEEFCLSRVQRTREGYVKKYFGLKNIVRLKKYLKGCFISRKAANVLDLKKPVYKHVLVDYKVKEDRELWDDFQKNKSVSSKSKCKNALLKAKFTAKYVKGLMLENPDKFYLCFSDHIDATEMVATELNCLAVTGKVPARRRGKIALEYQTGKHKVLAATIGSFSEGVNLFKSHNLILNDFPWVPGDIEQLFRRILRKGQKEVCTFHIIGGSEQDRYINNLLLQKTKVVKEVIE